LPNPGAGSAGDGGGKDDGRDGHADGRCGIGSAEPVPGAQLAGVEGLPAGARGVYMPRSQQSLRKPSPGALDFEWRAAPGRHDPPSTRGRPAASPALADLVPPWVRLRNHHHIMAGTFPHTNAIHPFPMRREGRRVEAREGDSGVNQDLERRYLVVGVNGSAASYAALQ
jgi:hypothetical protein